MRLFDKNRWKHINEEAAYMWERNPIFKQLQLGVTIFYLILFWGAFKYQSPELGTLAVLVFLISALLWCLPIGEFLAIVWKWMEY